MDLSSLNNRQDPVAGRAPLVLGGHTDASLSEAVCRIIEAPRVSRGWSSGLMFSVALLILFVVLIFYLVFTGIGIWGVNNPVGWGFAIVNFVFWVGIGHAGTLISAILFLFRQRWRTGINRAAEAMTIFAVICAGVFPGIHVGRLWFVYWVFPLPNQMQMWPNFRSPLLWDVFAVGTYFTVSLLFWYMGMVPDIATVRDRSRGTLRRFVYGLLCLGWRNSHRHWHRYERMYALLAALAAPLVLSVHSVVSFDFAVSALPGWHTTIFPPYFVAGAIYSGFAMVVTLLIPARKLLALETVITVRHIENMTKIMLVTGCMVGYAYGMEFFISWYSGNPTERFTFINRAFGPYSWAYWTMVICNVFVPQFLWSRRLRRNLLVIFLLSLFINLGMWFERFVIVVTSLANDFVPSSWGYFIPTWVDVGMLLGSFGLFLSLFLLFVRFLPFVAISEIKLTLAEERHAAEAHPRAAPQPAPDPTVGRAPLAGDAGTGVKG